MLKNNLKIIYVTTMQILRKTIKIDQNTKGILFVVNKDVLIELLLMETFVDCY